MARQSAHPAADKEPNKKPGAVTCPTLRCVGISAAFALAAFHGGPVSAEWRDIRLVASSRRAANITPADTFSTVAPALPTPAVPPSDPPRAFLLAARSAAQAGRMGEAQEALERAETRLLDWTASPSGHSRTDDQRPVVDVAQARRALAADDRPGTLVAIDDALATIGGVVQTAPVAPTALSRFSPPPSLPPPVPVAPPEPTITTALLPGRWALHGAKYAWVRPDSKPRPVQSVASVPGRYVWQDRAYGWVPPHADVQ